MAPYEPGDDPGEAQPAQKMQFSSTVDNLHPLAQGELGSLPALWRHTSVMGQMLSCKPLLMDIPALGEGADTSQSGPQQL